MNTLKTRSWQGKPITNTRHKPARKKKVEVELRMWHHRPATPKLSRNLRRINVTWRGVQQKKNSKEKLFYSRFPQSESDFKRQNKFDCTANFLVSEEKKVFVSTELSDTKSGKNFSCRKTHKMKRLLIKRLDWKEEKLNFLSLVFGPAGSFSVSVSICVVEEKLTLGWNALNDLFIKNIVARRC